MVVRLVLAVFGKDQLTSGPCLNTFTPSGGSPSDALGDILMTLKQ